MEWTDSLSVGVTEIDNQHKELINRVNIFFSKIDSPEKEVLDVLDYLSGYVVTHFKDEEALQVKYNFPSYVEHKKIHDEFIKTVGGIRKDIEENGFTMITKSLVGSTLVNWLVLHICKMDKLVGDHIHASRGA
jgi:hemerythrin